MVASAISSGMPALDELLGGLIPGDNVVWVGDHEPEYVAFEAAFLRTAAAAHPTLFVAVGRTEVKRTMPAGVVTIDATSGSEFARPAPLADELERLLHAQPLTCIVIDGLGALARRWGIDEAVAFFVRTCPMMLLHDAVTYWRVPRNVGAAAIDRMRKVTQCLLELRAGQLRVVKAESRRPSLPGSTYHLRLVGDVVSVTADAAGGRLAQGLATLRRDLGLTQAQLAEAANVTPSAISQAESGARGLSLETVLQLSDRLGVGLDRVVSGRPDSGYRLARHDRSRTLQRGGVIALSDDAAVGMRAYLVSLQGGQVGAPPVTHDGVQLLAVTRGLVQVEIGDDTPVLRSGDTIVAGAEPIRSWRNLRREPAAFYWALRD